MSKNRLDQLERYRKNARRRMLDHAKKCPRCKLNQPCRQGEQIEDKAFAADGRYHAAK